MFSAIYQNNAVNIYECYFEKPKEEEPEQLPFDNVSPTAKTLQCFRYPGDISKGKVAASHMSFAYDDEGKNMAVAYSNMTYSSFTIENPTSYVWHLGKHK